MFLRDSEYFLVREENFLDDSNCLRSDLETSQSRTESNFRLADHNLDDYDYCLGIRDQGLETVENGLQDPGQSFLF
jgi:hypothetical protein